MKRFLFYLTLAIFLTSCASTQILTENELAEIPKKSTIIKGYFYDRSLSNDSIYEILIENLLEEGFRIEKDDKQHHYILTDGKQILTYDAKVRITFTIKDNHIIARPEWMGGASNQAAQMAMVGFKTDLTWSTAYSGMHGIPQLAFDYTVKFMKKFCNYLKYE